MGYGKADIFGFGQDGAMVSLNNGDGTFKPPTTVVNDFCYSTGWDSNITYPRYLACLRRTDRADIIGFGYGSVMVSLNNGDGTFSPPKTVVNDFCPINGWYSNITYPRFLANLVHSWLPDIIGFGQNGVMVSLNNGDGTFKPPTTVINDFCYNTGWDSNITYPRFLADITGDGKADIIGFGQNGVMVSLNNGDGTFKPPTTVVNDFCYNTGWDSNVTYPRFLADITGDGKADIIGFGYGSVMVSLNNGDGTFSPPTTVVNDFCPINRWGSNNTYPRFLADITGDGKADIIGFGQNGVMVSLNNGDGTFKPPTTVVNDFCYSTGWDSNITYPRYLAYLTLNDLPDIIGFGNGSVMVSLNNGDGTFKPPKTVVNDFCYSTRWFSNITYPRFLQAYSFIE